MLKNLVHQSHPARTLFPWHMPFAFGSSSTASFPIRPKLDFRQKQNNICVRYVRRNITALASTSANSPSNIKAVVTAKPIAGFSTHDYSQGALLLELVSAEIDPSTEVDPNTRKEKEPIRVTTGHQMSIENNEVKYECDFKVPSGFGAIGAVLVENEHCKEMYVKKIVISGFPDGRDVNVTCNSWVQPKSNHSEKRVFFTNKSYLPVETPEGLKSLRESELLSLQANDRGERKKTDRIYDYDVYNDLGDPDNNAESARPVLGGNEHPYPRRCRTGRPRCETDDSSETRSADFYVPRDEAISDMKAQSFKMIFSALLEIFTRLYAVHGGRDLPFPSFTAIDSLFNKGVEPPPPDRNGVSGHLRTILKFADVLRLETPEMVKRDRFSWLRDEEFARQTLAGPNPYTIQLVTEWPLKSNLDPEIYGEPKSKITKALVEREIKDFMSFDKALDERKLFVLDYHDLLLPYVNKVRELEKRTLYGSRTLFFLTPDGTLRPLAIELTRPPAGNGEPQWKQVYTPSLDDIGTGYWLWRFAKAHVLAHDSAIHQLVSHWLRTHCAVEPYIIATNRRLSTMHPVYRLLHPHFRNTMEINALARQQLISANGIVESTFSPLKYALELSSVAYDQLWRFDLQALPEDLISRGMAEEDLSAPHGLRLTIKDYPFANDGLLLWDAIKDWVTDYVNFYYPIESLVESDKELEAWWTEIRTVGHGDKKDEPWWPKLKTPSDLIGILTTMIWVASGHHAAVNFGQYAFGGYFPNRPSIARTEMPTECCEKLKLFLENPEAALLTCFPSQLQATIVMAVVDVLSNHLTDEEYIGNEIEPCWAEVPTIKKAFEKFNERLKNLEWIIDARNADKKLKNRSGVGVVPYELLKPFSGPGVTGKGVPNSISI
uniref:Lipoxygenase n=1 Tax=Davidia involucrata TaxID=16924 RepID=A0A5B7BF19_DAVIN